MHRPHILKINEIFPSVQGEGLRLGKPTIFIRLSGCNLKCPFCDTKYAWQAGQEMTVARIMDKVKKIHQDFPAPWVCLTGGEPLLQNIGVLVHGLKEEGFKIQVETNATLSPIPGVSWYTVSPKSPDYYFRPSYKKRAKEVKIVVIKGLDLDVIKKLRDDFPEKIPILLQPLSASPASGKLAMKLLARTLEAGMKNIQMTAQVHKMFGWR
jgi:organic radical activating enzyme